jgi:hypothetical protein
MSKSDKKTVNDWFREWLDDEQTSPALLKIVIDFIRPVFIAGFTAGVKHERFTNPHDKIKP